MNYTAENPIRKTLAQKIQETQENILKNKQLEAERKTKEAEELQKRQETERDQIIRNTVERCLQKAEVLISQIITEQPSVNCAVIGVFGLSAFDPNTKMYLHPLLIYAEKEGMEIFFLEKNKRLLDSNMIPTETEIKFDSSSFQAIEGGGLSFRLHGKHYYCWIPRLSILPNALGNNLQIIFSWPKVNF